MRVAVFSTQPYDHRSFEAVNATFGHELVFLEPRLTEKTVALAKGFAAVCVFVNDVLDATVLRALAGDGTRVIALRCAGFNNVDLRVASELGMTVVRVPAYSPYAVAEHTVGMMLTLNRQIHRAAARVREGNFALEGLLGFDMHGRTVGVIGTGKIGMLVARILTGFGCRLLAYDRFPSSECEAFGVRYVELLELVAEADIITLHCPLTPETRHVINADAISRMKRGVMLINTSRGKLVDTRAVIAALKSGQIGYVGLDVYEEEAEVFFQDHSSVVLQDDALARLLTFPNVLITGHQAFFTREALGQIATTTLENLADVEAGTACPNVVAPN
jgi:D-lactate dehydrogenase